MQTWNYEEKRKFTRFEVNLSLKNLNPMLKKEMYCYTHDISAKGIGILSNDAVSVGTDLEIWLYMPDNGEQIHTKGKVVWSNRIESGQYRAGIELDKEELQPIPLVLRTIRMRNKYYG